MLCAMAPIPFLLLGFKFYCKSSFDSGIKYFTKDETPKDVETPARAEDESRDRDCDRDSDRVTVRFCHPALYQELLVPIMHEKCRRILSKIYCGHLNSDLDTTADDSDVFSMNRMSKKDLGKATDPERPVTFVFESIMELENFDNCCDFVAETVSDVEPISRSLDITQSRTLLSAFGGRERKCPKSDKS